MAELIPAITGFVGVLVGGLLTAWIERGKYQRQARDEVQRQKIEDLRSFQASLDGLIDAIGHDAGEFDKLRREGENLSGWHPWRTYNAFREADKRAVWVTYPQIKGQWERIRLDAKSAQALIATIRNEARHDEIDDRLIEVMTLRTFELVKASTDKYSEFNSSLEALYESLLAPAPSRPTESVRKRLSGLRRRTRD